MLLSMATKTKRLPHEAAPRNVAIMLTQQLERDLESERKGEGRSMGWMVAVLLREALDARKTERAPA